MTINTTNDIRTYLNDARSDLVALGVEYVDAVIDQVQFSDHPAYGQDWSEWLDEWMPGLIEECVRSVDALK